MKMRTLANHCFDLRFQRPRLEQIKVKECFLIEFGKDNQSNL